MTELLDFNTLSKLAQESPEAFEEYRDATLQAYFQSLPEDQRRKAEQLQWKVDGKLRCYKNSVSRMNKIAELMFDSVYELNAVLNGQEVDK